MELDVFIIMRKMPNWASFRFKQILLNQPHEHVHDC